MYSPSHAKTCDEFPGPIFASLGLWAQSSKSGLDFRVGSGFWPGSGRVQAGFGPGSGLKLTKTSGLIRAWDILFVLGAQKHNQNNLATLLNFYGPNLSFGFFWAWFGLQISFRVQAMFGLIFSGLGRVRAGGFRPAGSGRVWVWTSRPVYNSVRAFQVLLKNCRIGDKPFTTLRAISPASKLNLQPLAPEVNVQPTGKLN